MECLWRMSFKWKRVCPLITMKSNSSQIKFFYGVVCGIRIFLSPCTKDSCRLYAHSRFSIYGKHHLQLK
ncbi:hypothetical protein HanPI659440_Chr09g0354261 [Helianthus annuus]|nr:hypothetical protein HanPI659440_Chr09g0354261 [Helianthus annuus]